MIIPEIIYIVTMLFSSVAAILAWVAKLRWSKEYSEAKNEIIRSKEAQIELLEQQIDVYKDLTPMRLREYFQSVKSQLEEYNDELQQRIVGLKEDAEKEKAILKDELVRVEEKQKQAILLYDHLQAVLGKDFDDGVIFQARTSTGFVQTGEKRLFQAEFFIAQEGERKESRHTGISTYSFRSALDRARKKYDELAEGRPYVYLITDKDGGLIYSSTGETRVSIPQEGEWILGGAGTDGSFEVIIRPKLRIGT